MKISQNDFDKVCMDRGMKKLMIGRVPSYINHEYNEGIEYITATKGIRTFIVDNGSRSYDSTPSSDIMETVNLIMNTETVYVPKNEKYEPDKLPPGKKIVIVPLPDSKRPVDDISNVNGLPEFLTSANMTAWGKMNTVDRVLMFQKTPQDKIEHVEVGKDAQGNKVFAPYVTGNYMFKEANAAFLFDWYLDNVVITTCPTGVGVTGRLYAWFKEYDKYLSRPATGYQELNKKVDVEMAKKGATTDAIKKGLSLFGFNSDVYSGERE